MKVRRAGLILFMLLMQSVGLAGKMPIAVAADNSWSFSGLLGARVLSIAVDPGSSAVVFAGTMNFGLFRSPDGGVNWTHITSPVVISDATISSIAVTAADSARVVAATSQGIFTSDDHGQTWSQSPASMGGPMGCADKVAISPVDANIVLATAINSEAQAPCTGFGLYRSTDGGQHFDFVCCDLTGFTGLAFAASAPHIAFATTFGDVLRSQDAGLTWQADNGNFIGSPNPTTLAVDPNDAQTIYLGSYGSGIFKTTNGGATWAPITGGIGTSDASHIAIYSRNQQIIFATGGDAPSTGTPGVYRTNDNEGTSWSPMMTGMGSHAIYGFAFDQSTPVNLYAGTASGIWKYTVATGASDYGLSINDAALFTNDTAVTLTLTAPPGTTQLEVSNDGGFAGAAWQSFTGSLPWTLSAVGSNILPRTVYARFITNGQQSGEYADDIVLDQTPPSGSLSITDGSALELYQGRALLDAGPTVSVTAKIFLPIVGRNFRSGFVGRTIAISATDNLSGVGELELSNSPSFALSTFVQAAETVDWFIPDAPGQHTVYGRLKDRAGNLSAVLTATTSLP